MRKAHINKQFTLRLRSVFCIPFSKKAHFNQKRECINMQKCRNLVRLYTNSCILAAPVRLELTTHGLTGAKSPSNYAFLSKK